MLSAWVAQPTIRKQILPLFFASLAMALICYDTLLLHCKILSLVATGTKEGPVKISEQADTSEKMWVKRGYKECGLQNMLMLSAWECLGLPDTLQPGVHF